MITNPTLVFFVVMLVILFAPIIMGKLRIPHLIGMVLAGVALGQYGFNILVRDESFELFGQVGLYYIMFLASLEMDIEGARKRHVQMSFFGVLTYAIPFLLSFLLGLTVLHYSVPVSLLLGCIMSSNTLVAYPMVSRYGLSRKPSVTLAVGASMMALLLSLVTLAVMVSSESGSGGWLHWLGFVGKFVAYCAGLILLVPRLSRWFLRRYSDAVMQFVFVMAILFLCAALSELIGLEGIFGAFFAGLIMNRYIPHTSPLMNRIEFIGNALFIPYFLIGVGMIINIRLLLHGGGIIMTVLLITLVGTLGKAAAAYVSQWFFRLPLSAGNMMFGLTSAHAAGAIAMVMVGRGMLAPDGTPLVGEELLNAIVLMILFTCIISSMITEQASQQIIVRDHEQDMPSDKSPDYDDERILVAVKYPEYADVLVDLAMAMRNEELRRSLIALNVVYDDDKLERSEQAASQLLKQVADYAAASDVRVRTQIRVAANIANGIKHAFRESHCSEIVIGLHGHGGDATNKFWGAFHQSLFNGLNRQIIMARIVQPLQTLRHIHVVVPSRAQLEAGFYRWLERMCRLAGNLSCRITFYARRDTLGWLERYVTNRHADVRAAFEDMEHWNEMPAVATTVKEDHLFVVVTARKDTISYKNAQERLPDELRQHFHGKNVLIIFPDQWGDPMEEMTFAQPQHREQLSAYDMFGRWIERMRRK